MSINGPNMTEEQIRLYLDRIEIEYPARLDGDYLTRLQRAHITHIAFENLDVMQGVKLHIDRERLFSKIISDRRGGVCSELNTLYNWLLESLGYQVESYISRVIAKSIPIQAMSHRVMCVAIGDSRYITDVGFNYEYHRVPLLLEEGLIQSDGECRYRFEREPMLGWVLHQEISSGWRRKISFTQSPCIDLDFVAPTLYAELDDKSKINKAVKVSLHRDGIFYAIRNNTFLREEQGEIIEIKALNPAHGDPEMMELIRNFFGIPVGEALKTETEG